VLEDPTKSATPGSATIILEADAGLLVPHYADLVDRKEGTHTPIVLRTFAPLKPRTRYVVAVRGARLAAFDGSGAAAELAPAPGGFRRLRDGGAQSDTALAPLVSHYDDGIFAPLARAGVVRAELQLAWDFTTGSSEQPVADMLRVRELTLAWLAANEPTVRVASTRDGSGNIAKILNLEVTAPLFLDKREPGGHLVHDPRDRSCRTERPRSSSSS